MNNPILYAGPPLVGAVIGYVTNDIAIKMLFRPLKAVRIFGVRVPFTPGILPRQRHKLADNIGRMVERELITEGILRQRLRQDDFRRTVERSVADFTATLLDGSVRGLAEQYSFIKVQDTPRLVAGLVHSLIQAPWFSRLLESGVVLLFEAYADQPLSRVLGTTPDSLEKKLHALIGGALCGNAQLVAGGAAQLADTAYPQLGQTLLAVLAKPDLRAELEAQGRIFLSSALLKLNVFQRFFVSAAQYDRTLHERMPEIIDDLIAQIAGLLDKPEIRQKTVALVHDAAQNLLSRVDSSERLAALIGSLIVPFLDRPVGELIRNFSGEEPADAALKLAAMLSTRARSVTEESITRGLDEYVASRMERSLGDLLAISPEAKLKIDRFLADTLLNVADERLSAALKTLDIRSLVSERVDALDMLDVERIVLDVLSDQLRWINVFGALLGAIIGVGQVILWYFWG